jgi:hypothetical protein
MIARSAPLVHALLAVASFAPLAAAIEPAPAPRPICPRFDLTYLPAVGRQGLIGFRPAGIVRNMPELGLQTRTFLELMSDHLPGFKLTAGDPPALAEIDECVMALSFEIRPQRSDDKHGSMLLGGKTPMVIRTTHPFAWDQLIRTWFPKAVQTHHAGRSYLRIRMEPLPKEAAMGSFCPDGRTIVIADEDAIRELIDRLAAGGPAPPPPPGWDEVNRHLVALTLDNTTEELIKGKMAKNKPGYDEVQALAGSFEYMSVGVSVGAGTTLKVSVTAADGRQAKVAADNIRRLFTLAAEHKSPRGEGTIAEEMAIDVSKNLVLDRTGRRVSGSTRMRRNLFKTLAMWIHGED